jgi:uncharacterized phage infection (PIP) family protein YhgE
MKKILILLFFLLITLASLGTYLYLSEKILEGNIKIAEGKKQIEDGEKMLAAGKNKLATGKRKLSQLKKANGLFQSIPFMNIANKVPVGGALLNAPNQIISQGNNKIAAGEEKIKSGEQQLAEGKLELSNGIKKLYQANIIRVTSGILALIFFSIFVALVIYWRKSLASIVKRKT